MSIELDDVTFDLREMVELIGMENFIKVFRFYVGRSVYVPLYKNLLIKDRNRKVIDEYNGKNLDELRLKYSMSNSQLKSGLNGK